MSAEKFLENGNKLIVDCEKAPGNDTSRYLDYLK